MGAIGRSERSQVENIGLALLETLIPRGDGIIEAVTSDVKEQRSSRRKGILTLYAPLFAGFDVAAGAPPVVCFAGPVVRVLCGGGVPATLWLVETAVRVLCGGIGPTVKVFPPCTMHPRNVFAAYGLGLAGVGEELAGTEEIVPTVMVFPPSTTHSRVGFATHALGPA